MIAIAVGSAAYHIVAPRQRGHVRPIVAFILRTLTARRRHLHASRNAFDAYWPVGARLRQETDYADQIPFKRFWIVWSQPSAEKKRLDRVGGLGADLRGATRRLRALRQLRVVVRDQG